MRYFADDDNYIGPGSYELKFRRFTGGSSSAAGESNVLTVSLTTTLPSPSPSPSPTPTLSPSTTPAPSPSLIPSPTPKPSLTPTPSPSPDLSPPPEGTIAGESTMIDLSGFGIPPSPAEALAEAGPVVPVLNQSRAKTVLLIGTGLVLASVAGFFVRRRIIRG